MGFFGLKLDLDLEMRAAHPDQKFQGVPPTPPGEEKNMAQNLSRTSTPSFHVAVRRNGH